MYNLNMEMKIYFYLLLVVIFTISSIIVRIFWKKKENFNIYQRIIYNIIRYSVVISLGLLILLLSLKRIYILFNFVHYESMKIIVQGVFLLSLAMIVIGVLNLKFLNKKNDSSKNQKYFNSNNREE